MGGCAELTSAIIAGIKRANRDRLLFFIDAKRDVCDLYGGDAIEFAAIFRLRPEVIELADGAFVPRCTVSEAVIGEVVADLDRHELKTIGVVPGRDGDWRNGRMVKL